MSQKWLVLKFGGSSVRGLDQWRSIAERVEERLAMGYRQLLVCSAVEGVTDLLHDLARNPGDGGAVERFRDIHVCLAAELDVEGGPWIDKACARLVRLAAELQNNDSPAQVAELLGTGEWLSTRLGWVYLNRKFATEWVDARGLLEAEPQPGHSQRRQWLSAECKAGVDASLRIGLEGCESVVITQGYIVGMAGGGSAVLGRGGSDTSAVLLGGRIEAERVEIWTDVPGLFSADPRILPEARLLRRLEYAEALEMAASGASVVQPRAVRAAAVTGTPLWIYDTARPEVGGTHINGDADNHEGAKAVVSQPAMAVMLLQNVDPRQEVGFLAGVFGAVAERGVSIDLVATSETTTTIAINRQANHLDDADLEELANVLRAQCRVTVYSDCVAVNIVGRGVRTALAGLGKAFEEFENTPLLMVSQSANDLCLSLLVRQGDDGKILKAAHDALIQITSETPMFGPCWRDL